METDEELAPRVALETVSAGGEDADPEQVAEGDEERGRAETDPDEAGEHGTQVPEEAEDEPEGAGFEDTDEELERNLAALLFASPDPLSEARLSKLLGGAPTARVQAGLLALSARLREAGLPWELRPIAGGWQLFTTPEVAETVSLLSKLKKDEKVSPAALETLAVVAYRQPVTKADVEAIRGVQVGPILRALVDRNLIKVAGRADVPGHPLLYATTRRFLDSFGLASLEDLPRDGELLGDS